MVSSNYIKLVLIQLISFLYIVIHSSYAGELCFAYASGNEILLLDHSDNTNVIFRNYQGTYRKRIEDFCFIDAGSNLIISTQEGIRFVDLVRKRTYFKKINLSRPLLYISPDFQITAIKDVRERVILLSTYDGNVLLDSNYMNSNNKIRVSTVLGWLDNQTLLCASWENINDKMTEYLLTTNGEIVTNGVLYEKLNFLKNRGYVRSVSPQYAVVNCVRKSWFFGLEAHYFKVFSLRNNSPKCIFQTSDFDADETYWCSDKKHVVFVDQYDTLFRGCGFRDFYLLNLETKSIKEIPYEIPYGGQLFEDLNIEIPLNVSDCSPIL